MFRGGWARARPELSPGRKARRRSSAAGWSDVASGFLPGPAGWAIAAAGGFGIFRKGGLERLFRDARLGRIHPANAFLTREVVAKTALGIGLDETPRWG